LQVSFVFFQRGFGIQDFGSQDERFLTGQGVIQLEGGYSDV
jgi:hypothetical protein